MLDVRDLSCPGLQPVTLTVADGACAAITGPSGSGKSRILRAIADLDPNTGAVSAGDMARAETAAPVWRRRVRFVAAEPAWWEPKIGAHFPLPDTAAALAQELGLSPDCFDWPVERASTGQRQRLALVRALLDEPAVLLLDEPTAALDAAARDGVEALIKARMQGGVTVLIATHDLAQAGRLADVTYRLSDGWLVEVTP